VALFLLNKCLYNKSMKLKTLLLSSLAVVLSGCSLNNVNAWKAIEINSDNYYRFFALECKSMENGQALVNSFLVRDALVVKKLSVTVDLSYVTYTNDVGVETFKTVTFEPDKNGDYTENLNVFTYASILSVKAEGKVKIKPFKTTAKKLTKDNFDSYFRFKFVTENNTKCLRMDRRLLSDNAYLIDKCVLKFVTKGTIDTSGEEKVVNAEEYETIEFKDVTIHGYALVEHEGFNLDLGYEVVEIKGTRVNPLF